MKSNLISRQKHTEKRSISDLSGQFSFHIYILAEKIKSERKNVRKTFNFGFEWMIFLPY